MKYLITGTGRCGTGYISKILTYSGIKCGHESIFKPFEVNKKEMDLYDADSSWFAAPILQNFNFTVIHIVRNPLKVLRSWLFDLTNVISLNSTKTTPLSGEYLFHHYPNIQKQKTQVDKAIVYYLECNNLIEKYKGEKFFFRVEDNPIKLFDFLRGKSPENYKKFQKYNTRNTGQNSIEDVKELLQQSSLFPELKFKILQYYPELKNEI